MRIGTVAAHFRADVEEGVERIGRTIEDARAADVDLLVLPHGALGGYHDHTDRPPDDPSVLPVPLDVDGPEVAAVRALAGELVVCFGITERVADSRANTAVVVHGDGVLGTHRKVFLPAGERRDYVAGPSLVPVATPLGLLGLLVDYDKTFPETARSLATAGARVIANPCAWPASRNREVSPARDRQRRMFDLYDAARAAENQLVFVSANQTGRHGSLEFFGQSKVVGPDGDMLVTTGARAGLATVDVDVDVVVEAARRTLHHVEEVAAWRA